MEFIWFAYLFILCCFHLCILTILHFADTFNLNKNVAGYNVLLVCLKDVTYIETERVVNIVDSSKKNKYTNIHISITRERTQTAH